MERKSIWHPVKKSLDAVDGQLDYDKLKDINLKLSKDIDGQFEEMFQDVTQEPKEILDAIEAVKRAYEESEKRDDVRSFITLYYGLSQLRNTTNHAMPQDKETEDIMRDIKRLCNKYREFVE